jgi:hypothetical protein
MFEKYVITAKQRARYANAPLAEERLRFMNHLEHERRGHSPLRAINARLLAIASEVDPSVARLQEKRKASNVSKHSSINQTLTSGLK